LIVMMLAQVRDPVVSEAWEFFGEANGVASVAEMQARIGPGEDPAIGCLFVRDVRFFPADAVADPPPQFAPKIVQGKSYDLADPAVAGFSRTSYG